MNVQAKLWAVAGHTEGIPQVDIDFVYADSYDNAIRASLRGKPYIEDVTQFLIDEETAGSYYHAVEVPDSVTTTTQKT